MQWKMENSFKKGHIIPLCNCEIGSSKTEGQKDEFIVGIVLVEIGVGLA